MNLWHLTFSKLLSSDVGTELMITSAAHAQTASPPSEHARRINPRIAYAALIAGILFIYSYPAVRTAFKTESLRLPAVAAPDLGLYLSITRLEKTPDGFALNPYYHIPVPYPVSYLKFRLGPWLFGFLNSAFAGRIWATLFVWNLLWWFLLCAAAIWLFSRFLPRPAIELVLAGVSLFALVSLAGVQRALTTWLHSPYTWPPGWLPYIRPFSPQVVMPLFLCYLGLQILVLTRKSFAVWGAMAVLQFLAFTAFPYATLMMAGITFVAVISFIFNKPRKTVWRELCFFLIVCAVPDITFALHGSGGFRLSFPDQTSLIHFQPDLLPKVVGKLWLLAALLVLVTALTRKLSPQVKWPLLGLGLSNLLFITGDAFVSERVFYLSDHIGYFYQPTIYILSMFLVSAYLPDEDRFRRMARIGSLVVIVLSFTCGLLMAEANYRTNLSYNTEQADLARWFAKGEVSAHDLVIVQFSGDAYDSSEWIPLLSGAEVLYCRNAQLSLTPEQNRDVQRLREVLYLYFTGKDRRWIENTTAFEPYGLYGELSSFRRPEDRARRLVAIRQEMLPLFDRVEQNDPAIRSFFRNFSRIWIVQQKSSPAFANDRLASYVDIGPQEPAGTLSVTTSVRK